MRLCKEITELAGEQWWTLPELAATEEKVWPDSVLPRQVGHVAVSRVDASRCRGAPATMRRGSGGLPTRWVR